MNLKDLKIKYIAFGASIIIVILTLIILIALRLNKKEEVIVQKEEIVQISATQVVQDFYNWYIAYQGSPFKSNAYKSMPQLSEDFLKDIEQRIFDNRLNYDPFVCKTNKPFGVGVVSQEIIGDKANVIINTDYGYNEGVSIDLEKDENTWVITMVNCPQIEQYRQIDENVQENRVSIFLINNNNKTTECNLNLVEVKRVPSNISDSLGSSLKELFAGVTIEDEKNNYSSGFIDNGQDILRNFKIEPNAITLTLLNKNQYFANISNCQEQQLLSQLKETLKYYGYEQEIVIQ